MAGNMIRLIKIYSITGLLFLFLQPGVAKAQLSTKPDSMLKSVRFDTLRLTLTDAERVFVKNNLLLLAQKYNVDATEALIIQAKLYPNPTISYDAGLNRPSGYPSEQAGQIQQEIVLTRKIKKQVDMAETNYTLSEDNFKDLLRTLKYTLRSNFYNIYYLQQIEKVYDEEIHALQMVVAAYKQVEDKEYVSEAEIVQVQAQLYSLQNEYQGWVDSTNDLESQTRLLLHIPPTVYISPEVNPAIVKADPLTYGLSTLLDSAYVNRTDYMIARDNLVLSRQNFVYQKALAVPDVFLSVGYDTHGSDWPNLVSLGFSIALPVFNRNQGNIKNAGSMIQANDAQLQYTQKSVDEQVFRGLQKAIDADKLYKGIDPAEMLKNYMARHVNLLTFQAFYDSYKTNIEQLNTILFNKVNCLETLNLLTGTNFYNK
jgi:cobalt-zinc-cadmium efflux system outer membrane protein